MLLKIKRTIFNYFYYFMNSNLRTTGFEQQIIWTKVVIVSASWNIQKYTLDSEWNIFQIHVCYEVILDW